MLDDFNTSKIMAYPFVKNEVMKLRSVINTDIETHLLLTIVYVLMKASYKSELIFNLMG